MAIFVDTHALVWFGLDDRRLTTVAKEAMLSQPILISSVVAYEFEDLNRRGRFDAFLDLSQIVEVLEGEVVDYPADCATIAGLLPSHHLDPVDRMLIAHAMQFDIPIVTGDGKIPHYPVRIIW